MRWNKLKLIYKLFLIKGYKSLKPFVFESKSLLAFIAVALTKLGSVCWFTIAPLNKGPNIPI